MGQMCVKYEENIQWVVSRVLKFLFDIFVYFFMPTLKKLKEKTKVSGNKKLSDKNKE